MDTHSDVVSPDFFKKCTELFRPLKCVHLVVHLVLIQNLLQVLFVLISVIDRQRNTLESKSACSANSVQVVLSVANPLVAATSLPRRHIKVDDDLGLGHVNAPSKHVCRDDHAHLSRSELGNHLITLLIAHLTEDDR